MERWHKVEGKELNVFRLHLLFSLIQGVITGVFALNELIFIKDMKASDYQLSVLLQLSVLVMLVSIVANEFLKRIANKRKMLRWAAFITHFPLLLLVLFPSNIDVYQNNSIYHYLFLGIFLFFYINLIVTLPAINQMLKEAYTHENFGRLYGYSSAANKVVIMITTVLFGFWLDKHNYSFLYIYPLMGILGYVSVFFLSKIPQVKYKPIRTSIIKSLKNSFAFTFDVLKTNKAFLHFELGFMFYGFAWMVSTAVIPIYFNDVFNMNHATYGFYKNGYNLLAIILLPYFGKLIGRIDARKFGAITFGSLMLFTFFLALSQYFPQFIEVGSIKIYYSLIIAYGFYGIFAATMALLWFIGSAYFCKKEETASYQSIHLTLTGMRGILSFQIGIWLYFAFGFTATFLIATTSLLIAVILMVWSYKRT
jgi:MFS family permease